MLDFYPEIEPFDHGFLKVSELHNIYYEQAGNPKGKPVVFLHGGPGGGIDDSRTRSLLGCNDRPAKGSAQKARLRAKPPVLGALTNPNGNPRWSGWHGRP